MICFEVSECNSHNSSIPHPEARTSSEHRLGKREIQNALLHAWIGPSWSLPTAFVRKTQENAQVGTHHRFGCVCRGERTARRQRQRHRGTRGRGARAVERRTLCVCWLFHTGRTIWNSVLNCERTRWRGRKRGRIESSTVRRRQCSLARRLIDVVTNSRKKE